jgi:hypothetical protein
MFSDAVPSSWEPEVNLSEDADMQFDRISINPNICHGQACVKGTRMPVDGELISYAVIGVWYNPRQCLRHRYESRPIDVGSLAADCGTRPSSPANSGW